MALFITRSKHRSLTNPSLIHLFSTSSSSTAPPSNQSTTENGTNSQFQQHHHQHQFSFSSKFSDVKANLKQRRQNSQYQNQPNKPNLPPLRKPSNSKTKASSLEEIRKNLAEFPHRSTAPPPTESNIAGPPSYSSQPQQILFEELYNRSRLAKSEDGNGSNESTLNRKNTPISGKLSFEKLRESLQQMRNSASLNRGRGRDPLSFSAFKGSLNLKPANEFDLTKSNVIGRTQGLPLSVPRKEDASVKARMSTEFVNMYSYRELGEKLRSLRPEVKEGEKGWFSLEELNERLRKLRELEEKETESRMGGLSFRDVRESLEKLKNTESRMGGVSFWDMIESFLKLKKSVEEKAKQELQEKETESRMGRVTFRDLRERLVKLKKLYQEKAKQSSIFPSR